MSEIAQNEFNDKTNIKVVGVGGAGGNAVNRMIAEGLQNVEFVAVNTDAKDLLRSDADVKISLSDKSSRGLGAGADPERGAKAAQDHQSDIEEALRGADMVFVTCGEGGGTGTGAGPEVDALIVIPNDRLLELSDRSIGIIEAFKTADTALLAGVQGITDLISMNSYIHVDFNDVNSILRGAGTALFGIGSARGEDRATQAAEIAISSPLLEESIEGAHGALINIAGPTDLKLQEASAATELVRKAIHPEAQIIWGLALDDAYGDEVRVTVIAAGFDPVAAQDDDTQSTVTPVVPTAADPATPVAQPAPAPAPAAQPAATAQPAFTPATGDSASLPFDDPTSAHPNIAVNDPAGDLDIPDFLR